MPVTKIDRGNYYVQIRYTKNGQKKVHKKRGFKTKSEARAYELAFNVEEMYDSSITISQLYNEQLEDKRYKVKQSTLDIYMDIYKLHISPYLAHTTIKELSNTKIKKWLNNVQLGYLERTGKVYSYKYMNTIATIFKSILLYGKKQGYYNDVFVVEPLKNPNKLNDRIQFWTYDQWQQFITVVGDEYWNDVFTFLYYLGLRKGELMALQWKDFDNKKLQIYKTLNKHLELTPPKTNNSNRIYELPTALIERLHAKKQGYKAIPGFSDDWFIFGDYEPLSRTTLTRHFNKYIKLSGVPKITIHSLRHSCVSFLKNQGMSYQSIASYIGDTELTVISVYSHVFGSEKEKIVNLLNEVL